MNSKLLVGLVVVAIGIVVGWYVLGGYRARQEGAMKQNETAQPVSPAPGTSGLETTSAGTGAAGAADMEKGGVAERTVATYTDSGFSPNPVTVKVGALVTFVNESSGAMWVASAVHPTHQLLPGFDQLKSVAKGGTYEYAFTKVGTWKYHNHVSPSDTGSVIVTP